MQDNRNVDSGCSQSSTVLSRFRTRRHRSFPCRDVWFLCGSAPTFYSLFNPVTVSMPVYWDSVPLRPVFLPVSPCQHPRSGPYLFAPPRSRPHSAILDFCALPPRDHRKLGVCTVPPYGFFISPSPSPFRNLGTVYRPAPRVSFSAPPPSLFRDFGILCHSAALQLSTRVILRAKVQNVAKVQQKIADKQLPIKNKPQRRKTAAKGSESEGLVDPWYRLHGRLC